MAYEQEQAPGVQSDEPQVDDARKARVEGWATRIKAAKKHFESDFKRMRDNQQFATAGADAAWIADKNYTVPIIVRHINQKVAQLYAKNPQAKATLRKRLYFKLWDGTPESIQGAIAASTPPAPAPMMGHNGGPPMDGAPPMGGDPMAAPMPEWQPDPNAVALVEEVNNVKIMMTQLKRQAQTLEILYNYFTSEQEPNFKISLKQLVRRTAINGVGYLKLDFQRLMESKPEVAARLEDMTAQLRQLEVLKHGVEKGDIAENDARMDELKTLIADLQKQVEVIVREGLVFDFPRSDEIIVDPKCRQLKGFVGADWIAHEWNDMAPEDVFGYWGVDVKGKFTPYDGGVVKTEGTPDDRKRCCVWEVQDKKNGQVFVLVDGYCDFVVEPASPRCRLERFWNIFALTTNDIEDCKRIYPPSDVELVKSAQEDMNEVRQSLREHRRSNRPATITPPGLSQQTKNDLQSRPAGALIEVKGLQIGQKASDLLQPMPINPIDPNLYNEQPYMQDVLRAVGSQESALGPVAGGDTTATESSIAESNRMSGLGSNVDDLDEFLSEVARNGGQLLMLEMSPESVLEIVGPGAVWPTLTREQVAKEITLTIRAGSSGRPNRAAELANIERGSTLLLQLPGVNPVPIGMKYADLLELDPEEVIIEGLPSITAVNAMASAPPPPTEIPGEQGGQGKDNAKKEDMPNRPSVPEMPMATTGPDVPANAMAA